MKRKNADHGQSRSRLTDYESSESPVSSENNDLMTKSLSVQTMDKVDRCTMCRAKTIHGVGVKPQPLRSPKKDDPVRTSKEEEEARRLILKVISLQQEQRHHGRTPHVHVPADADDEQCRPVHNARYQDGEYGVGVGPPLLRSTKKMRWTPT
ncbi:hypothetical protein JTE90_016259 [Oedothorax gibbosus]|uniref:Uncharacterized protein n=1 Tax=Oedothorax gibbosus TaxID=931172 RepID=A0AAV6VS85_9ARAC|nr:hypothetical protein JTE90_016259 [Oedothorax gibbosus]